MEPILAVVAGWMLCSAVPLQATKTSFVTEVRIADTGPYRFLLDTGTTITVISPDVARQAGIIASGSTGAVSSSGAVKVENAIAANFRVATIALPRLAVLIVDLPRFQSHGHIDGILGMNFFAGKSFFIDVGRRCLEMDVAAERVRGGGKLRSEEVVGRVAMNVQGMNFILDSAASFAVLTSDRASRLASMDGTTELTTVAGRRQVASGVIHRLDLDGVRLTEVPAARNTTSDPREDALLPLNIFSSVYVDAKRRFVILNGRLK